MDRSLCQESAFRASQRFPRSCSKFGLLPNCRPSNRNPLDRPEPGLEMCIGLQSSVDSRTLDDRYLERSAMPPLGPLYACIGDRLIGTGLQGSSNCGRLVTITSGSNRTWKFGTDRKGFLSKSRLPVSIYRICVDRCARCGPKCPRPRSASPTRVIGLARFDRWIAPADSDGSRIHWERQPMHTKCSFRIHASGIAQAFACAMILGASCSLHAQSEQTYDVVILNGHVMDPESGLDAVRNVGIQSGKVSAI